MRTLISVFRRSRSLVSKALVILTDDVNNEAPQTIDKFEAVIKLCSRFASTLNTNGNIRSGERLFRLENVQCNSPSEVLQQELQCFS